MKDTDSDLDGPDTSDREPAYKSEAEEESKEEWATESRERGWAREREGE